MVVTSAIGSGAQAAARYAATCRAIASSGCMIEQESRPRPAAPATSAEPGDVAAIQAGGCGSCTGLGVTIRRGKRNRSEAYSTYSSRHIPVTIPIASRQSSRDRSRSTPKAVCSMGVERPVPHSTRPPDSTSTVAAFSAMRCGGVKPKGVRVTPKPSRILPGLRPGGAPDGLPVGALPGGPPAVRMGPAPGPRHVDLVEHVQVHGGTLRQI